MKPTAKMLAPTLSARERARATAAEIKAALDAADREVLSNAAAARAALSPAGLLARVEEIERTLERMTNPPTLGVTGTGGTGNEPSRPVWDASRRRAIGRLAALRSRIEQTLKPRLDDGPRPSPDRAADHKVVDEKLFAQALDRTTRALDDQPPRKKDD